MNGKDNKNKIKTFEDLEVWKVCQELRKNITELARRLPAGEKNRLSDQMIRASRSVTANIAEGYGRFHYQENIRFCRQARGSLYEIIDHLMVAHDEGYLIDDKLKVYREDISRSLSLLNGYIRYLKKAKLASQNEQQDL